MDFDVGFGFRVLVGDGFDVVFGDVVVVFVV